MSVSGNSFIPVQWSQTYYGLDGPWQAIAAGVGGYDNGTSPSVQWTGVDLLPGGTWETYVLNGTVCGFNATADCGAGGLWNQTFAYGGSLAGQTQDPDSLPINWGPEDANFQGDMRYYQNTSVYVQNLNLNGIGSNQFPELNVPNNSIVVVPSGYIAWPNGRITSPNIGTLALGADQPEQNFTVGSGVDDVIVTHNVPGYLYRTQGMSNSYTIQIGSTRLGYGGSLIFGGYDQGRGIGPVTSWANTPVPLQDIVLGVETGGSPFNFTSKTGLLLNTTSQPSPIPIYADPIAPYLHLPNSTCQALAGVLPIYFDPTSMYYLWDTKHPNYTQTVTSAAYLGFIFPPAFGSQDPVTIKVPMIYLNLTLKSEASGLPGDVAYFPCQTYIPQSLGQGSAGSGSGSYTLGRAFLQAAILGRNWATGISWMAQAPGPGAGKAGLGYNPQAIHPSDSTISFAPDKNLFNASMQGYWTPLPVPATSSSATPTSPPTASPTASTTLSPSQSAQPSPALTVGAQAGIGIGAAALAIIATIAALSIFFRHRSGRSSSHSELLAGDDRVQDVKLPAYEMSPQHYDGHGHVHYNPHGSWPELSAQLEPRELQDQREPQELGSGPITPAQRGQDGQRSPGVT